MNEEEKLKEEKNDVVMWSCQVPTTLDKLVEALIFTNFHRTKSELIRDGVKKIAIEIAKRIIANKTEFLKIHPEKKEYIDQIENYLKILEAETEK